MAAHHHIKQQTPQNHKTNNTRSTPPTNLYFPNPPLAPPKIARRNPKPLGSTEKAPKMVKVPTGTGCPKRVPKPP